MSRNTSESIHVAMQDTELEVVGTYRPAGGGSYSAYGWDQPWSAHFEAERILVGGVEVSQGEFDRWIDAGVEDVCLEKMGEEA